MLNEVVSYMEQNKLKNLALQLLQSGEVLVKTDAGEATALEADAALASIKTGRRLNLDSEIQKLETVVAELKAERDALPEAAEAAIKKGPP